MASGDDLVNARRLWVRATVEAAVLDRLGDVGGADVRLAGEVGDRACHAQDARVRACREAEPLARELEEAATRRSETAGAPDLAPAEPGVDASTPAHLPDARRRHPRPHGGRRLGGDALVGEAADRHARHLDVQVDAIEERPGDARAIAVDERRAAAAGVR